MMRYEGLAGHLHASPISRATERTDRTSAGHSDGVLRLFPEALLEALRRLFKDAMPNAGYGNRFDPSDPRTLGSLVIILMIIFNAIIEAGGIQVVLRSLGYP